jgi:hypothetical protein
MTPVFRPNSLDVGALAGSIDTLRELGQMARAGIFAICAGVAAAACAHESPEQNLAQAAVAAPAMAAAETCPQVGGGESTDCTRLPMRPGEACLAIWAAFPEFGDVTAHGGWPLRGGARSADAPAPEPHRYGCFGSNAEHGNLYVTGMYRGGDYWKPAAWRADAACGPNGLKRGYPVSRTRECQGAPFDVAVTTASVDISRTGTR